MCSHSPKNLEFGHFIKLLLAEDSKEMYQNIIIMHVQNQGLTLTVVCWPLACRNNILASRNLEQWAILAGENFFKNIDLIKFELFANLTKCSSNTNFLALKRNIFQVMVLRFCLRSGSSRAQSISTR